MDQLIIMFIFLWMLKNVNSELTNNTYDGLIISLDTNLRLQQTNSTELITNIKNLLTDASSAMYRATGNRVYLGDIYIIVPKEWGLETSGAPPLRADIEVNNEGLGGNSPYTVQNGMCGAPGLKISLPLDYLMDSSVQSNYGDPGKVMSNELLKMMYGVYDEFGHPGDPWAPYSFFDETLSETRVTSCTDSEVLEGYWMDKDGTSCNPSEDDLGCRMNINGSEAEYSTLFVTYVDNIDRVCNSSTHDYVAPTVHNKICGTSVLSVMMQSPDFKDGANGPGDEWQPTNPWFYLLSEEYFSTFLLIDINGGDKESEVSSILDSILETIPLILESKTISMFGVALFEGYDNDSYNINYLNNKTFTPIESITYEDIVNFFNVNVTESNMSLVERALYDTLDQLEKEQGDEQVNILVVQMQRTDENYTDVEPAGNIYVSGVVYGGSSNNEWLQQLTVEYGGIYYVNVNYDPVVAVQAMLSLTTDTEIIILMRKDMTVTTDISMVQIYIDPSVGIKTEFQVEWEGREITATLRDPDGTVIQSTSEMPTSILFAVEDAAEGTWSLSLNSTRNEIPTTVTVTSQPRNETDQVSVHVWSSSSEADHNLEDAPLAFYASLRLGPSPISGANVTLQLSTDNSLQTGGISIQLIDDGLGLPDITAKDGIYSGYLSTIEGFGLDEDEFQVIADVMLQRSDEQMNSFRRLGGEQGQRSPSTRSNTVNPFFDDPVPSPVDMSLDRYLTSAFSQQLSGTFKYDPPPSPIVDFRITKMTSNEDQVEVTLEWTAPGNDFNAGKVSSYDLRYTDDQSMLEDFESWTLISQAEIIEGSLDPKVAGELQTSTVTLLFRDVTYFMAIRGVDEAENKGALSSKMNVYGSFVPTSSPYVPYEHDFVGSAGFILLIIYVVLLVLAGVGGVVYYVMRDKTTRLDQFKMRFRGNRTL